MSDWLFFILLGLLAGAGLWDFITFRDRPTRNRK